MDSPLPPTHPDECKYTCTIGGTFVMMWTLPLPRPMWSVISWDTLERWATLDQLWTREYSNTHKFCLYKTHFGYALRFSNAIMYEILCVDCSTGMEWTVPTILSWVRLTVLLVIIWWYYSVATPLLLDHVNETEMKFLWSAVSYSVHISCACDIYECMVMELRNNLFQSTHALEAYSYIMWDSVAIIG